MATKAELESELVELRRQLADRPKIEAVETVPSEELEISSDHDGSKAEQPIDWEHEVTELMAQFDDITPKKPLLFALGAFSIGYLLGRSK